MGKPKHNAGHRKHKIHNKKARSKTANNVKKKSKNVEFKFTHLLKNQWKTILQLYVFALLIRWLFIDHSITRSFMYYINFILFFTLQYFGYAFLLLVAVFSLEIIKILFLKYIRTAVTKLFFGKPKKHKFLKNYPWFDYLTTFVGPHLFIIALYIFLVVLFSSILFLFILPFAILLLGYTK